MRSRYFRFRVVTPKVTEAEIVGDDDHDVVLHSVQMVNEIRGGDDRQYELGDPRIFAARAEHRLRLHDTNWKIVLKRMVLLNRHIPIPNLTFII